VREALVDADLQESMAAETAIVLRTSTSLDCFEVSAIVLVIELFEDEERDMFDLSPERGLGLSGLFGRVFDRSTLALVTAKSTSFVFDVRSIGLRSSAFLTMFPRFSNPGLLNTVCRLGDRFCSAAIDAAFEAPGDWEG
jgi:hypothetical protein